MELLKAFSDFTGADVAASNDLTGSSEKNGNWELETNIGIVETDAISATSFSETLFTNANNIKDYNLSINLDMACISEAVYSNGKEARDLLSKAGWELHEAVSVNNAQSLCAVRENGHSKEMAIAFRGTEFGLTREGILDIITDITPWGFTNYYKAVRSSVEDWLTKAYLGNFDKIYFTGHSLGGVVAQIAMLDILENPNMDIWEQLTLTQDLNLLNAPLKAGDRFMDGQREDLKVAVREFVLDKVQGITFGAPSISIDSPNVFANESLNWLQGINVGNLANSALALVKNSLNEAFRLNSKIDLSKYKNNLQQFEHKVGVDEDYVAVLLEKIKDSGEAVSIVEFAQAQGWLPILDIIDGVQTLIDRVTLIGRLTYDMVKRYYNQEKLIDLPTTHFDDPVAQLDSGKINSDESLAHIGSELGKLMNVMIDEKTYDDYLAHEGAEKGSFGSLMTLHAKSLYKESLLKLSAGENIIDFNSRLLSDQKSHSPQLISHSSATNGSDLLKNGGGIHGMDGNDILVANSTTTTMSGGSGSNIYVVKGAGSTITLQGSQNWHDSLYFVMHGELTTQVNGEALEITMTNMEGTRTVIIPNWYAKEGSQYQLNAIKTIKPSETTGELFIDGAKTYFNQYAINEEDRMTSLNVALLNQGGKKDDVILGSLTNDTMHGDAGDDNMSGRDGNDIIRGGAGNDTIDGGAGNDIIIDTEGYNTILAGTGDDVITVARGEIKGGDGIDTLNSDFSSLSSFGSYDYNNGLQYRSSTAPNYLVDYTDSLEDVEGLMSDSSAIISVYNSQYTNKENTLATWQGIEKSSITGTNTTDRYEGNDLIIVQGAGGTYKGGTAANYDTLYADWSKVTTAIKWDSNITTEQTLGNQVKVQGIERLLVRLGSGADVINNTNTTGDTVYAGAGNDNIKLGAGANTVDAGTGNDIINIGTSNQWNTIHAGTGNDIITVARGEIKGGDGIDTLNSDFSSLSSFGSYDYNNGLQYRSSTAPNYLVDYTDSLEDVEGLMSDSSAIISVYNSQYTNKENTLATWQGIEKSSITGTNTTDRYEGNDLIIVQGAGGTYKGGTAANYDTLYADWSTSTQSINWNNLEQSLKTINGVKIEGMERLLLRLGSGSDTIKASSYDVADYIYGGAGNDTIYGYAGKDRLEGNEGNDTLIGGQGNDTLIGGQGNDVFQFSIGDGVDTIEDSSGTTEIHLNVAKSAVTISNENNGVRIKYSANDSILVTNYNTETAKSLAYRIMYNDGTTQNLASLYYTVIEDKGRNNETNSTLTNTNKDELIYGYGGNDIIKAGLGNDTLHGGEGKDTVDYTNVTVSVNVNLNLSITQKGDGTGTDNLVDIENIIGSNFDDNLIGNDYGNIINGGKGADAMLGGLGDDTYHVDNKKDMVVEKAEEGTDMVLSTISYTLTNNVENLTLLGKSNINATGNTLANTLTGNTANNILNGNKGADIMIGGLGDDTYHVDNKKDMVVEKAKEGTDTVLSTISYTLTDNVENLTLLGKSAINATGNTLSNTLTGNTANNTLNGGKGADTMIGGLGDDTYHVDNKNDQVVEKAKEGTDTVLSTISYTLTDNVENLTLLGKSAINATGNALSNKLIGNSANNILNGGLGKDYLTGGDGADTFVFTNVNESNLKYSDVILDFKSGIDKIDLSSIDADMSQEGNQSFTGLLTENQGFTKAGQLKFSNNMLYGNTDNDSEAEFAIQLTDINKLNLTDIIL